MPPSSPKLRRKPMHVNELAMADRIRELEERLKKAADFIENSSGNCVRWCVYGRDCWHLRDGCKLLIEITA